MPIGFNLLLWTTHVGEHHRPILEELKKTGYDSVEIPVFEGEPEHFRRLGAMLDDLGLERTVVTANGNPDENPIGSTAASRQGGRDWIRRSLDNTAALGATIIGGPMHSTLAHYSGAGPTDEEKERLVDFHRWAGDEAKARGLTMAVEALNRFECYVLTTMADLKEHLDRVDHPNVRGMYDTFHANIEEKDPVGAIRTIAPYLVHVHISENDRGTPGKGHIAFGPVFSTLKDLGYRGHLTIEAFGRALPDLAGATRVWRDLSPSPEEVYRVGYQTIRSGWA